jgi:phosphoribosylglycinamide formyltransferase 1
VGLGPAVEYTSRVPTLDLGVLVSGNGTNLQAILDAAAQGSLDARVRVVVSNKPGVRALERAERAGVPARVIVHRDFPSREAFDQALVRELRERGVGWVVLAGFMRVLTPVFLDAFPGRTVNIHPALLPAFPGVNAQKQALEYGVKLTGCTVHFVDGGVDTGPIIAQRAVPVLDGDDEASLSERIHREEHALLVEALRWIAAGRVESLARPGARPRVRIGERPPP